MHKTAFEAQISAIDSPLSWYNTGISIPLIDYITWRIDFKSAHDGNIYTQLSCDW